MNLLDPLCAGVRGCESGTAEIYQRGSVTRANYWLGNGGFEGGGAVTSGANVTLDANGGAQVYVNEYVDVVCKNSAGVETRRFTAGHAATCVEVDSDSFTGQEYSGGGLAVSRPIALSAVLDKWNNSAGAPDWEVLVGGVATTLQAALSGTPFGSSIFNVTASAYGAIGDGVTDDRTAIAAAITAAAAVNGIVFFPPGTYKLGSSITVPYDVWLVGCGPNASIIAPSHATNNHIVFTGDASAVRPTLMTGLAVLPSVATTGDLVVSSAVATLHLVVADCLLGETSNTDGNAIHVGSNTSAVLEMHRCRLVQGGSEALAIGNAQQLVFRDCSFKLTGASIAIQGLNVDAEGCVFDNSSVVGAGTAMDSNTGTNIVPNTTTALNYRIHNCTFSNPASNNIIAIATSASADVNAASILIESGNTFASSVFPYLIRWGTASKGAVFWLGSRLGRRLEVTSNTSPTALTYEVMGYETVVIKRSTNADQTVSFTNTNGTFSILPDGNYTTVMVWNESGGNIAAETFSFNGAGAAVGINDNLSATIHLKHLQVESACGPYALGIPVATGDPL
jgi:hypothetical protein